MSSSAWLFCVSDDHAKSTAALFSLVSSARLHRIDAEEYLRRRWRHAVGVELLRAPATTRVQYAALDGEPVPAFATRVA